MKIINKEDLKKYIAIELGEPYNRVELHDAHYETIIDDCIDMFHRYTAGEGCIYEYGVMQLRKGQNDYNLRSIGNETAYAINANGIPNVNKINIINSTAWEDSVINIESVISVTMSNTMTGGINNLFTPAHGWFYAGGGASGLGLMNTSSQQIAYGYSGGGNSGNVTGDAGGGMQGNILGYNSNRDPFMPLSNYVMMRQNMALIDRLFGVRLMAVWRADAGILRISPTPTKDTTALVLYYKREDAIYLYNNILYRNLVIAACGVKWGEILTKYGTSMAGGGTLNGDSILSNYKEKYAAALEAIKGETWRPFFRRG